MHWATLDTTDLAGKTLFMRVALSLAMFPRINVAPTAILPGSQTSTRESRGAPSRRTLERRPHGTLLTQSPKRHLQCPIPFCASLPHRNSRRRIKHVENTSSLFRSRSTNQTLLPVSPLTTSHLTGTPRLEMRADAYLTLSTRTEYRNGR